MIIIFKESEIFRDDPYSKEEAEITITEHFRNLFGSLRRELNIVRIDKDLSIEEVERVQVMIIKGE